MWIAFSLYPLSFLFTVPLNGILLNYVDVKLHASLIKFNETDNDIKSCYIINSSWKPLNIFLCKNVSDHHVFQSEISQDIHCDSLYKSHLLIHATEKMTEIDRIDLIYS